MRNTLALTLVSLPSVVAVAILCVIAISKLGATIVGYYSLDVTKRGKETVRMIFRGEGVL